MAQTIQKNDWELFRAAGQTPPHIRSVVRQSWQRCQARAEIAELACAPQLNEDALYALWARRRLFRDAARPALERAGHMLAETGAILLLCDEKGVITDDFGDVHVLARGRENHLQVGGCWDELEIGTNAIGTAIETRRPLQIFGVEHFSEAIQRWNCAAAPITDPVSKALLGLVDISSPADIVRPDAAALSAVLALQIEDRLRLRVMQERQRLGEHLQNCRARWPSDDIVVFDRYGVAHPDGLAEGPGQMPSSAFDTLGDRLPLLADLPRDAFVSTLHEVVPNANFEPVEHLGERIGVVVGLKPRPRSARAVPQISGRLMDTSAVMARIFDRARRLLAADLPLLIVGETGTGKHTLAHALHLDLGVEKDEWERLNAGSLAHAVADTKHPDPRLDRLVRSGGTLCVEEPAMAAPAAQAVLLDWLDELAASPRQIRIITLTHEDLDRARDEKRLRADLFFRLAGARIDLPALKERAEDIPDLLRQLVKAQAERKHARPLNFTPAACARLAAYDWPGNLDEMRHLVESLAAVSRTGLIDVADLPGQIVTLTPERTASRLRARERAEIVSAIAGAGGNLTRAARDLGIARSTLYLKLDAHRIPHPKKS